MPSRFFASPSSVRAKIEERRPRHEQASNEHIQLVNEQLVADLKAMQENTENFEANVKKIKKAYTKGV